MSAQAPLRLFVRLPGTLVGTLSPSGWPVDRGLVRPILRASVWSAEAAPASRTGAPNASLEYPAGRDLQRLNLDGHSSPPRTPARPQALVDLRPPRLGVRSFPSRA